MPNGWIMRLLLRSFFFAGWLSILATSSAADPGPKALLHAARDGNAQLAIKLAQAGADVQQRGTLDDTALHWAAFNGSHALARLLIERGVDVDARVRDGNTPLHQAAYTFGSLVLCYVDDILIATSTATAHLKRLREVFGLIKKAGLKLKASKCKIMHNETKFLGRKITRDGVLPDAGAIKKLKPGWHPRTRNS